MKRGEDYRQKLNGKRVLVVGLGKSGKAAVKALCECGAVVSVLFDGNTVNASQHTLTLFGTRGILKVGNPDTFGGSVSLLYADQPECTLPFTHGYNGANTVEPSPFDFYGHRGVGAAEMAYAIRRGRANRCSKEYGLHCLEVLAGMETSIATGRTVELATRFEMKPLAPGYYSSFMGVFLNSVRCIFGI